MTFTQLEIFSIVAELGSFTAAGQRLAISQSAVSHALKQLETEWQVTLLSRGPSGIEVTEIGRSLLVRVREDGLRAVPPEAVVGADASQQRVFLSIGPDELVALPER